MKLNYFDESSCPLCGASLALEYSDPIPFRVNGVLKGVNIPVDCHNCEKEYVLNYTTTVTSTVTERETIVIISTTTSSTSTHRTLINPDIPVYVTILR